METMRRYSRRTFVAWVGGAGAGFYLFGRLPGLSAPIALAQIPVVTLDPAVVPKFATPMLIPPVMPRAATIRQPGAKPLDYYEISMRPDPAADSPRRPSRDHGLGVRRDRGGEQPRAAHPQRSLAHDRGDVEQAGSCEVDQRPRRREREIPSASASRRPDPALGQPTRRPSRAGQPPDVRRDTRSRTRVRCRSSRTCTVPSAWPTTATATRRPGTCRRPATSRRTTPPRAPGTTSSPARRPGRTASSGGPATRPSSTRTTTAPRRSGTTTTRSA